MTVEDSATYTVQLTLIYLHYVQAGYRNSEVCVEVLTCIDDG